MAPAPMCGPREVGRHVSGSTTGVIVGYVHRVRGVAAVEEMLRRAAEDRTPAELADTSSWSSYAQAIALFDAAAEVTGDPEVARRIGEELLRQHHGTEVAALLRSLGSPGEVLRNVAATAAKYSTVSSMEAVEVSDRHAIVTARNVDGVARHPHVCLYTQGVLSQAAPLFGMADAVVHELECQRRGDPCCRYRVDWDPASGPDREPRKRIEFLEAQLASMTERFEALQATAGELAAAGDVESVLAAITRRAGLAVRAPQFVLAVRVHNADDLHIHSIGVPSADLAHVVKDILAAASDEDSGSRLIVDVVADEHAFGKLAALYPPESAFFAQERRLLAAYAAHAASALATAAALDTSRHRDASARALLALASWLAEEVTREGMAARVCDTTRAIVDADQVSVWLWDEQAAVATMAASTGMSPDAEEALRAVEIKAGMSTSFERMLVDPAPRWITPGMQDKAMAALLEIAGLAAAAAVPMVAQGEFYGVVAAGVTSAPNRLREDHDLVERLTGVARQAATALRNARLVEQIQHQAMHDWVTGLPNQRLLEDRVERALYHADRAGEHAALLFLDLDRFKAVNDSLGHHAGDALLRLVGERLLGVVRAGDTVARIGGDEFAVLLPEISAPDDALVVAQKIRAALAEPYAIDGHTARTGASVGVAVYPERGRSYRELLRAADTAMYQAKRGAALRASDRAEMARPEVLAPASTRPEAG